MAAAQQSRKHASELHVAGKNRLLSVAEEAGQTIKGLERVTLKRKAPLHNPHIAMTHAFFPVTGVASLIANVGGGSELEVCTTGNEGMVGIPLLLGADRTHTETFVQIEGDFMRITRVALERELRSDSPLAQITRRYVQAFFVQAAQSAACRRFHQIEQRLCRCILESHDRVGEATMPPAQEFLALTLGVQRPGVTLAAAQLQKAGLITYQRGVIEVVDREGLEAISCECYAIVRTEYERLLC